MDRYDIVYEQLYVYKPLYCRYSSIRGVKADRREAVLVREAPEPYMTLREPPRCRILRARIMRARARAQRARVYI